MQTLLIFSGVHEVKTSGYSKAIIWGPVDFKYNLSSSHCLRAKTPLFQDFPSEKNGSHFTIIHKGWKICLRNLSASASIALSLVSSVEDKRTNQPERELFLALSFKNTISQLSYETKAKKVKKRNELLRHQFT